MNPDSFIYQVERLADRAAKIAKTLQDKYDRRREEWRDGPQGEACQDQIEAMEEAENTLTELVEEIKIAFEVSDDPDSNDDADADDDDDDDDDQD